MATEDTADTEDTETGMEDMGIAEGSAGIGITATVDSATTIREIVGVVEIAADMEGGEHGKEQRA